MELFHFNMDWTIIVGAKDVALYSDPDCLTPLSGDIHFGQIPQGETREFPIYARNEGQIPTDVLINVTPAPEDVEVTVAPALLENLMPLQVQAVQIHIIAAVDAALEFGTVTVVGTDGL